MSELEAATEEATPKMVLFTTMMLSCRSPCWWSVISSMGVATPSAWSKMEARLLHARGRADFFDDEIVFFGGFLGGQSSEIFAFSPLRLGIVFFSAFKMTSASEMAASSRWRNVFDGGDEIFFEAYLRSLKKY